MHLKTVEGAVLPVTEATCVLLASVDVHIALVFAQVVPAAAHLSAPVAAVRGSRCTVVFRGIAGAGGVARSGVEPARVGVPPTSCNDNEETRSAINTSNNNSNNKCTNERNSHQQIPVLPGAQVSPPTVVNKAHQICYKTHCLIIVKIYDKSFVRHAGGGGQYHCCR